MHGLSPSAVNARDRNAVFFYFFTLDENRFDIGNFKRCWHAVDGMDFDPKSLSIIARRAARTFSMLPVESQRHLQDFLAADDTLDIWARQVCARIESFNPANTAHALWSFAKFRIMPGLDTLSLLRDRAQDLMPRFTNIDISTTLHAFSTLAVYPGHDFMDDCKHRLMEILHTLNRRDLAIMSWSMALFSSFDKTADLKDIAQALMAQTVGHPLRDADKLQIDMAALWFNLPQYRQTGITTHHSKSRWEYLIGDRLRLNGVRMDGEADHYIPELYRNVDFRTTQNGRDIIIETDGPYHFIRDSGTDEFFYSGPSHFQNAVFNRIYPESSVLRLRVTDSLHAGHDRSALALQEHFKTVAPGIYVSDIKEGRLKFFRIAANEFTP